MIPLDRRAVNDVLRRRGLAISAEDFLGALHEMAPTPSAALTRAEREFLLAHSSLDAADLSDEAREHTHAAVVAARMDAADAVDGAALSTSEVAALLARDPANVRRSRLRGDLYAWDSRGELRFPTWQFEGGSAAPGLRPVLDAVPRHTHPLVLERFMTTIREELDGHTPVTWLHTGGAPERVAVLVRDWERM